VLPDSVDDDTPLRWLGITPDNKIPEDSISEHVRKKKKIEDERDGLVYEHYGYRKAYKNLPEGDDLEEFHEKVKQTWGELPTVLDATAGGGSIPFESVRYELPTIANELNPVASVILKAVLEHPRANGDLSDDIRRWGEKIDSIASDELDEYFPTQSNEKTLAYLWAHTISCPDCGLTVPLSPNWWLEKNSSSKGIAARPTVSESSDEVEFEIVELPDDVKKEEYNPTNGTVSRGKATCPRCQVTIDGDEVKRQAQEEGMGTQLFAVYNEKISSGDRGFRGPNEEDVEAHLKAQSKVQNDVDLSTILSEERYIGPADRAKNYGVNQWRDMYTSRQLLTHYEYWQAYENVKSDIREEYTTEETKVILTFLSFAADKAISMNCRQSRWDSSVPKLVQIFDRHDFSFKWSFGENNLIAEGLGYDWVLDSTVEVYEELRELSSQSSAPVDVLQGDASNLPLDKNEVEAIVLDPPYYDNVMYAELSDFFYVWMKKYLGDVYPDFFTNELTNKSSEAVANSAKFEDLTDGSQSKSDLAKSDYESKMTNIFSELNRVLSTDGIFTLMFTHKKTEAWDTLTKALIDAGFVVTATHPVSTENPNSLHQSGKNSAESTILLSAEITDRSDDDVTLWSDIRRTTREVARDRAQNLDEGEIDFAKVDVILASFGPTLQVFTENYPVVDDEGSPVSPQTALDEARIAVRDYFIDKYLNEGVREVDPTTEWYILSWLIFEVQRFPYDEARRLAIGVGEDLDSLKRDYRMWRKRSGDVILRPHTDRVQDINKDPDNRSGRKPVDPDALSVSIALDKIHAAMHVYDTKGAPEAWNWMNDRNCGSDPAFKATLEALLRVLPSNHEDWNIARDIAAGETGELLDLDLDAGIFQENDNDEDRQGRLKDF
jgi:adenine-specific DNA methylase